MCSGEAHPEELGIPAAPMGVGVAVFRMRHSRFTQMLMAEEVGGR